MRIKRPALNLLSVLFARKWFRPLPVYTNEVSRAIYAKEKSKPSNRNLIMKKQGESVVYPNAAMSYAMDAVMIC